MLLVYHMSNIWGSTTMHVSIVIKQHVDDRSCDMAFTKHVTDASNVLAKHVTNIRIVIVMHETTLEKHSSNMKYGTRRTKERYAPKYRKGVLAQILKRSTCNSCIKHQNCIHKACNNNRKHSYNMYHVLNTKIAFTQHVTSNITCIMN